MKYRSCEDGRLTPPPESGAGTMPEGQFDWGGFLPNGNGGVRRSPRRGRQPRDGAQRHKVA